MNYNKSVAIRRLRLKPTNWIRENQNHKTTLLKDHVSFRIGAYNNKPAPWQV